MIEEVFMKGLVERLNTHSNFVFEYENIDTLDISNLYLEEKGIMCYVFHDKRQRYIKLDQILSSIDNGKIYFHHRDPVLLHDPEATEKSLKAIEYSVNTFAHNFTKEKFVVPGLQRDDPLE